MKLVAFALLGAFAVSGSAFAQTCASPLPLPPKAGGPGGSYAPLSGTTCGGEVGLNFGGVIYPHPSVIYSFTANAAANGASSAVTISAGTDREIGVTTNCTTAPSFIGFNGAGGTMNIPAGALAVGQTYLLIVATDPSIPPQPPVCGPYTLGITGTLPVALQNFSVE